MKYEIINPSDKCYITADDPVLAKIACAVLGKRLYGLRSETGETTMYPFDSLAKSTGMKTADLSAYINEHVLELAKVFRSLEYETERTSFNDIGGYSESLADAIEKKGGQP